MPPSPVEELALLDLDRYVLTFSLYLGAHLCLQSLQVVGHLLTVNTCNLFVCSVELCAMCRGLLPCCLTQQETEFIDLCALE